MNIFNRVVAIALAIFIALLAFVGLEKGYTRVQNSCLIYESDRSDESIADSGYIVFGTSADTLPLSYLNSDFEPNECRYVTGIFNNNSDYLSEIDIIYAQSVARALGLQLRVAYVPRNELTAALESGKVDFISSFGLNKAEINGFSSGDIYYTIKPVFVFGDTASGKLKDIKSIRTFSDSKLIELINQSKLQDVTWQSVSTFENLVSNLGDNCAYLTEAACVKDTVTYKAAPLTNNEEAKCRFVFRTENQNISAAIKSAISRIGLEKKDFYVDEQKIVHSSNIEQVQTQSSNEMFSEDEVYRTFATNNFANGGEVFSGENDTVYIAFQNTLYHYDSTMNLIRKYEGYTCGQKAFAINSKVYTLDGSNNKVCRILDIETGNSESILFKNRFFPFKTSSLHKARRLLNGKNGIITNKDYMELISMFSRDRLKYADSRYLWKNYNAMLRFHMLRYDTKLLHTQKYTNHLTLFGVSRFHYNVYNDCAYNIEENSMFCYDFSGKKHCVETQNGIGNVKKYILDNNGVFYFISQSSKKYAIYKWKINGYCDKLYTCDNEPINIYEQGDYVIVFGHDLFTVLNKESGKIAERVKKDS